MISERSAGRGFEALLPPKVPLSGGLCGAILYTNNMFYVNIITYFRKKIIPQSDKKISSLLRRY